MGQLFRKDFVCDKCIHSKVCKDIESADSLYKKATNVISVDLDNASGLTPFMFNFRCENYQQQMFNNYR